MEPSVQIEQWEPTYRSIEMMIGDPLTHVHLSTMSTVSTPVEMAS